MENIKYIEVGGQKVKLSADNENVSQSFIFRSTKEEFLDAIDWMLNAMREGGPDQLMNQLSDTTTLINLIETYCVKSREEIGLTDEILEKLKTGEMASQYIMAPGQPLVYAMAEMEKLMAESGSSAESGLPINSGDIAYDEDATLESMADSSFILSGVQGADLWSAFDIARGRGMTSPDMGGIMNQLIGQFLNGRGLGLPTMLYNEYMPYILEDESVHALIGHFAHWGMGVPAAFLIMLLGGPFDGGADFAIPFTWDLECPVIISDTKVIYPGAFTMLLLVLLLVVGGGMM